MGNADAYRRSVDLSNAVTAPASSPTMQPTASTSTKPATRPQRTASRSKSSDRAGRPRSQMSRSPTRGLSTEARTQCCCSPALGSTTVRWARYPRPGRRLSMRFCEIREYDTDGKAVRGELFYDQVTMLVQLGHMPPPGG